MVDPHCNVCCAFQELTFGDTTVSVYNTVFSGLLLISVVILLTVLHSHYKKALVTGFDYFIYSTVATTLKGCSHSPSLQYSRHVCIKKIYNKTYYEVSIQSS